jgi:PTH1 family peptidyl-tRNA hydrolase
VKLIVGLGNPGLVYAGSRHNIGFQCIGAYAKKHGIEFNKKQGKARVGIGEVSGTKVVLARPQTFMNSSGEAVEYLVKRYKVGPDDLIVIHDDLDLPLGKIRIRRGGRAAGHHGIESILEYLEDADFIRVRIGIGRPEITSGSGEDAVIRFVLSNFTDEEKRTVAPVVVRAGEALDSLLADGLEKAMNIFNREPPSALDKPE